jgi:hypothetical protein
MVLLFLEGVGNAFAEVFGGIGECQESVGHDLNGQQLVSCKAVQANGPFVEAAKGQEGREPISPSVCAKAQVGRASRLCN